MFLPGFKPPPPAGAAYWLCFEGDKLLAREGADPFPKLLDPSELGLQPTATHFLGELDGVACFAADVVPGATPPAEWSFRGLRGVMLHATEELATLAGRAFQICHWDRTHRFCGRCGKPTEPAPAERAKTCPSCGLTSYPRVSPAVIVLVHRGDEMLLARAKNFPEAFFSTLAGFVEPGESLEDTIHREIREEVGVEVDGLTYFGSQPWPFPHSLMVGFVARWASGEIHADGVEIAEAGWFTAKTIPRIPPRLSIAGQMIGWFCDGRPPR